MTDGKQNRLGEAAVILATAALLVSACQRQESAGTPTAQSSTEVYSIAVTAATPSALGSCTSSLNGTTAYVQSPVSLWSCQSKTWIQIPCTNLLAGALAYASASQTLRSEERRVGKECRSR